jgi:hypothetical protein
MAPWVCQPLLLMPRSQTGAEFADVCYEPRDHTHSARNDRAWATACSPEVLACMSHGIRSTVNRRYAPMPDVGATS